MAVQTLKMTYLTARGTPTLVLVPVLAAGIVVGSVAARAQAPAQTPSTAQPPAAPAQTPAQTPAPPFPAGSKFAYLDIQRVAAESKEGQAANAKVEELTKAKLTEIENKNKELQASQQKLSQNQSVMSVEARLALQKDIERLNLEIQRMSQDAEADMADLQQTLQLEFQKRLVPEIEKLAAEKQLHFIFSAEGGLIWADRALDLTDDIIQRLNGPTP